MIKHFLTSVLFFKICYSQEITGELHNSPVIETVKTQTDSMNCDIIVTYYDSNSVATIEQRSNHQLYGIYLSYHRNGKLKSSGHFNPVSPEVVEEIEYEECFGASYGTDFIVSIDCYIVPLKGLKCGLWQYFNETGTLYSMGNYENGKKEGIWMYYNSIGILTKKEIWKHGKHIQNTE